MDLGFPEIPVWPSFPESAIAVRWGSRPAFLGGQGEQVINPPDARHSHLPLHHGVTACCPSALIQFPLVLPHNPDGGIF